MPCINDYSTVSCLKKKYFFNKKNYPLIFNKILNNLKYYKIKKNLSFPHFPQIFINIYNLNYPHICGKC